MTRNAYDPVKRGLDIVVGSVAFVVALPVMVVTGVVVAMKLGRPVLFLHPRPGRGGKIFTLIKFRTMLNPDPGRELLTDEQRLTAFGRKLRSTSLDELPTLINVIRGDMSLVGPRPLHVRYLERYSPEQARRHDVRPGLTGLAQINGRNSLGWPEKLALDTEYVDTRSFGRDLHIIVRTIGLVFRREGISAEGHATAHEFRGTERAQD